MKRLGKATLLLLFAFVLVPILRAETALRSGAVPAAVRIAVDASNPGTPLKRVWPYFGFDECNFAVAPDARELMRTLSGSQADPVFIRCHFLLNSGDGTPALKWGSTNVYTEDAFGRPVYDWRIMDAVMDAIVGSGTFPLVEIGFMPKALSVRPEPYQHVYPPQQWAGWAYPPKDHSKWAGLIREWAKHAAQRYPDAERNWLWELWNEPDIFYWQGSFEDYCRLFDHTESALHEVLPKAVFGGPHTTGPEWRKAATFLRDFLRHCRNGTNLATGKTGTRLDYIGFHSKGSTSLADGSPRMNLGLNLANNKIGFGIVAEFPEYRQTPIIIGECDPEGLAALSSAVHPANGYRNGSAYAAYEAALMKHTLDLAERAKVNLQGVLTWAFLFEGKSYFEGFRTLATNGIAKPVLNVFKMLGRLDGRRIPVDSEGARGAESIIAERVIGAPDIDGLAASTGTTSQVLVWNYHDDIAPAPATAVRIVITAPEPGFRRALVAHDRIDEDHSNAHTAWRRAGSPQAPSPAQIAALKKAGELERLGPDRFVEVKDGRIVFEFDLPRHAVSLFDVRWIR